MGQTNYRTSACPLLAALLAMLFAAGQPATAADDAIEREQLAALVRQIDLIDRQAEHAAHTASQQRARYHFDHARLREDLQRVRTGIQDYLTPPRAQPRDPVELSGGLPPVQSDLRPGGSTMNAAQVSAFQANGGFAPAAVATVVLGLVFAVLLLWGVWAMRTAYTGWAEQRLSQRQFLGVVVRFVAMYLVLTYFLLS